MPPNSGNATSDESLDSAMDGVLREHKKRPEWGVAIRVWSRGEHRGYQFEDGKLRIITEAFEHMMRTVERPAPEAERLNAELWRLSGLVRARDERRSAVRKHGTCSVTFDEQLALFLTDYPGGFADDQWVRDVRGSQAGRASARHREPAIARAQSLLAAEELAALIQSDDHAVVLSRAQRALEGCSLVTSSQRAPLAAMHPANERGFALAMNDWLHGTGPKEQPFDRLVTSLDSPKRHPTWPLITAFAALVHPDQHLCVKPSVFMQQAAVLAPGLTLQRRPNHLEYDRVRQLAQGVTEELHARQHPPTDWMDVHDFVWATMRPAAVARIEATRKAKPAAEPPVPAAT